MAEFCADCFNEEFGTNYPARRFYLSNEPELCEGCGKFKRVVEAKRPPFLIEIFRIPFTFFRIAFRYIHFLLSNLLNKKP